MKMNHLKINKKLLLALTTTMALTGCDLNYRETGCEIGEYHLHRYEKSGLVRYSNLEYLSISGYNWTDSVRFPDESLKSVYNMEWYSDLLRIEDNELYLKDVEDSRNDYLEYRYQYEGLEHVYQNVIMQYYKDATLYSWTEDENHENLTGETRICHPVYRGYKIENGRIIASPWVDSLLQIKEEYPYFKENELYKVRDKETNKELDYEDGPDRGQRQKNIRMHYI